MNKFKRAVTPKIPWKEFYEQNKKLIFKTKPEAKNFDKAELKKAIHAMWSEDRGAEYWINDTYQVQKIRLKPHQHNFGEGEEITWLSIKRLDKQPAKDWRHFQQIKNEMCGTEREGIEIFPAESRLVDTANQFHLFVMPEGAKIPILVFNTREVSNEGSDMSWGKSVQRPLGEEL